MCRDFFAKKQFNIFLSYNFSYQDPNGWEGITVVPVGHLSDILVVIIGIWQSGVREDQNMAQNGPRTSKTFGFGALKRPLNGSRILTMNLKWSPELI